MAYIQKLSYKAITVFFLFILLAGASSCKKGKPKANQAPETEMSVKEINLSGDNRLNSTVRLSWYGTDEDGYIERFEISLDNQNWSSTTVQDSVFRFDIPAGQDTADIDFYVRAIDNEGLKDPTPAYLSVPLKNTPPQVSFNNTPGPQDTALIVSTFNWEASDADGDETITQVEVKVNEGSWQNINLSENLISFVLDPSVQSGAATADLYYGTDNTADITGVDGFKANDLNTLYIRATDIAGGVSPVDTSATYYLKNKSQGADLLWISGQSPVITQKYKSVLDNINIQYDLLNYGAEIDGSKMPSYWDPTFKLISSLYPKMFVNSGQATFTNDVTGQIKTMLEFMAPVMLEYSNSGGKAFITTSFNKDKNLSEISGPYPVDSLITSSQGQARISPDSALVPLLAGNYPEVKPQNFQTGVVPIAASGDADPFYRAQLLKVNGWEGTDVVAAVRRPNNIWSQVFFGLELHYYNQDPQKLEQLFQEILINEF